MSSIIWSVSYWVEAERLWQFAGEGDRKWAYARRVQLAQQGHKARIRWRHAVVVDPVVEQL
jgi:hypothetical protein